MKKVLIVAALMGLALTGCDKYKDSYEAVMLTESYNATSDIIGFYKFNGLKSIELKKVDDNALKYSASSKDGTVNVFYDNGDGKETLFTIKGGENVTSSFEINAQKVYIIIETVGACESGSFEFTFNELTEK